MSELFQPLEFPLLGRRLIEASAGTGKTYNIANLVLRLLLGDGFRPLTIDRILVVTFTRAATSELQGRIRDKIEQALHAFRQPDEYRRQGGDPFISTLLAACANDKERLKTAAGRLNDALICMDEASILTIHSFAIRAIQTFLFETGALSEVSLSESGDQRRETIVNDCWRSLQLTDSENTEKYLQAAGLNDRQAFVRWMLSVPQEASILPSFARVQGKTLHDYLAEIEAQAEQLISHQLDERDALKKRWQSVFAGMDENSIKEQLRIIDVELPEGRGKRTSSTDLYKTISKWMTSKEARLSLPSGAVIAEKIAVFLQQPAQTETASLVCDWISHAQQSFDALAFYRRHFSALLAHWMQWQGAQVDLSAMQLDDVIFLINQRLAAGDKDSERLRRAITGAWPVCLVDEFQDTDPAQFVMFNRLYQPVHDSGFFMIGDPKQSIYAFRGADIFSYLSVRSDVVRAQQAGDRQIFSLATNFRSKATLIAACNALFVEQPGRPSFVYQGIDYQPVSSSEDEPFRHDKGRLCSDCDLVSDKAMVFIGNPHTGSDAVADNKDALLSLYARDTAERIAALLQHGSINSKGERKPLQGSDIAVLVSNRQQAAMVRHALASQQPAIASVYQSQRDSVFSQSEIAADICLILRAMNEPENRMRLKAAIATPLYRQFRADFSLLDQLDNDDATHEALIDEFAGYRRQWQRHGVLTALNTLFRQRRLAQAFARHSQGDRLLTDFRHLGDLLQQHASGCASAEQLVDWYARQLLDDSALDEDSKRIRLESDDNLVRIVTIHVSKGLEYPVVFLPFFFLPKVVRGNSRLPLVHHPERDYRAEINFEQDSETIAALMQQEQMAEEMRLLYVALTRAVYQCYVGISAAVYGVQKMTLFDRSVWQHLLQLENPMPLWQEIRQALQDKLAVCVDAIAFRQLGDQQRQDRADRAVPAVHAQLLEPVVPALRPSLWMMTSYSRLVNAQQYVATRGKDDEQPLADETADLQPEQQQRQPQWDNDIRFQLKGSVNTGDCLHAILEAVAQDGGRFLAAGSQSADAFAQLVATYMFRYGLAQPDDEQDSTGQVADWLYAVLQTPLQQGREILTLHSLFSRRQVLAEMTFDFAIGHRGIVNIAEHINPILEQAGARPIQLPAGDQLQGMMNGAIDLLFVDENQVYIADYKSSTLGKNPQAYRQAGMEQAMRNHHYDLQYLIYCVAVHRYCRSRFADDYRYDNGARLSFGGVYYLFLRGIGIAGEAADTGIWFRRPAAALIEALDAALAGGEA